MSFATLGVSTEIQKALRDKGYREPTEIQSQLIPAIYTKRDILAGAATGTGKTAGFVLPILHEISKLPDSSTDPKALIIAPTRELVRQIESSVHTYSKHLSTRCVALYGGANLSAQTNRLKRGSDIVVATSGRLLEHIKQRSISLDRVEYLVLDEADTILDMGFLHEISEILSLLPSQRQNILISATLTGSVKTLSNKILKKPLLIEVDSSSSTCSSVKQIVYPVTQEKKSELLSYLIGSKNYKQVLLFVRKIEIADIVTKELVSSGLSSLAIHGQKSSGARSRALQSFKDGNVRVLVATDIAARGIDIPELDVVINYDIPHVKSDYIHRIGRTGRAGREGLAITLISPEEYHSLGDLERLLGRAIPKEYLDDYAPPRETKISKGAKSNTKKPRTHGSFGNKKKNPRTGKKRKTTKRDGWSR